MATESSDTQHPLSVPDRGALAEVGTAGLARTDSNKEETVTELGGDTLRAALRFLPVARALKADLEESIHTENYQGIGDVALRSFRNVQTSIGQVTGDTFIVTLGSDLPDDASDKEKVWQALLAVDQLVAYLGPQAGFPSESQVVQDRRFQNYKPITIGNITGAKADKIIEQISKRVQGDEGPGEEDDEEAES